ncbi:MAG: 50S ribosomal protein L10 [Phycisphaerales bacterium]|nr:50S ribosomal protein L10 [Phycisphaerales bacterium]
MSKTVKGYVINDYASRVQGHENGVLLSLRGLKGIPTTKLRKDLRKKNIRIAVVRNSLARKAFAGGGLEGMLADATGQSALAFGGESVVAVARELIDALRTNPEIELKAAVLDGVIFKGKAGVEALSRYPTRDEAIAQAVGIILGPGRTLLAAAKGPGAKVAGIVATIKDKLEKGETIAAK